MQSLTVHAGTQKTPRHLWCGRIFARNCFEIVFLRLPPPVHFKLTQCNLLEHFSSIHHHLTVAHPSGAFRWKSIQNLSLNPWPGSLDIFPHRNGNLHPSQWASHGTGAEISFIILQIYHCCLSYHRVFLSSWRPQLTNLQECPIPSWFQPFPATCSHSSSRRSNMGFWFDVPKWQPDWRFPNHPN